MPLDQLIPAPSPAQTPPDGEAACVRESRRMDRLGALARLRERTELISIKLCALIEGKLPGDACGSLARIADPVLAFTRAATAIRRIVALEEQIDESAEERATRLAELAAKRTKEVAAVERVPADRKIHLRASNRIVRDAMLKAIAARDGSLDEFSRCSLLNDLTSDLDLPDYADDIDLVIGQIEKELDTILGPPEGDNAANDDDDAPPRKPVSDFPAQAADVYAAVRRATEAISRMQETIGTG